MDLGDFVPISKIWPWFWILGYFYHEFRKSLCFMLLLKGDLSQVCTKIELGGQTQNLKYKGIEDWCLAVVHFRHKQVLWVSTDLVDVRKDCQQGTMPQTICSLNMYLTTQPNFYKLGLRWLYNGNDDFCPRIYNLFGAEKTKRSWKKATAAD